MKWAYTILRTLLGLVFLLSSVLYFIGYNGAPEFTGETKLFFDGLNASGYIITLTKITELIGGLMLLSGQFVALGLIILAPVTVNILFINILHMRNGIPIAVIITGISLFLAWVNRAKYAPLFEPK